LRLDKNQKSNISFRKEVRAAAKCFIEKGIQMDSRERIIIHKNGKTDENYEN